MTKNKDSEEYRQFLINTILAKKLYEKQKQEKKEEKPEGLGDILKIIFDKTGVSWVVEKLWGEDCGCNKRQGILNKWLSFRKRKK